MGEHTKRHYIYGLGFGPEKVLEMYKNIQTILGCCQNANSREQSLTHVPRT